MEVWIFEPDLERMRKERMLSQSFKELLQEHIKDGGQAYVNIDLACETPLLRLEVYPWTKDSKEVLLLKEQIVQELKLSYGKWERKFNSHNGTFYWETTRLMDEPFEGLKFEVLCTLNNASAQECKVYKVEKTITCYESDCSQEEKELA